MKKLIFSIVLGILITIPAKTSAQNNRICFAGIALPFDIKSESLGFGMEISTIKQEVGIGAEVEYIPENSLNNGDITSARAFLLWKGTEEFYVKTALGAQTFRSEFFPEVVKNKFSFGVGAVFILNKVYLGVKPNLSLGSGNAVSLHTISFSIGIKFE